MTDIAIKVENLTKEFQIGQERSGDFRESFGNTLKTMLGTKGNKETFTALNDISFEVKKGEALGIIGRNGAGKSTLLKILSRITEPTKGRIEINGRVSSLLEVGTGFHPELTGRENIYLNGTILGMTRREVKAKFDEIIDFSGVEKFIDTPVKHYSSGMKVRLAFSVAAHLEPEILIIDEVLAVGDAEFQKKCMGKMDDVTKKEGRTVIFVSHDMNTIKKLCSKTILLEHGKLDSFDATELIVKKYISNSVINVNKLVDIKLFKPRSESNEITILSIQCDYNINTLNLNFQFVLDSKVKINELVLNINFKNSSLNTLITVMNLDVDFNYSIIEGQNVIRLELTQIKLTPGNYYVDFGINKYQSKTFDVVLNYPVLKLDNTGQFDLIPYIDKRKGDLIWTSVVWKRV